jgi:hypothetical protein
LNPICNRFKLKKLAFFAKKTFNRQKSATNFRFDETSCGRILEPSSSNLIVKQFPEFYASSGSYRQFSEPTQREKQLFGKKLSTVRPNR